MDEEEFIIHIEKLTTKKRKKTSIPTFLCIGVKDLTEMEKSALKLTNDGKWYIDKYRCSKCYLCKLKSPYVALDDEHFPYISETKDDRTYELTVDDQLYFESVLATYEEEVGISKWVYCIFRFFNISKTFTECAISKEYIPKEVLKKLDKYREDGVYGKSVIVDIEGTTNEFVFVFENKKFSTNSDDWIKDALKQIILYAASKIYQEKRNDVVFILCYNGPYIIRDRVVNIIEKNDELKILYEIFGKKPNYKFVLLPTTALFEVIKKSLKEGRKDKKWIIEAILSRVEKLPLKKSGNK